MMTSMYKRGWFQDSHRHGLAARGIKSNYYATKFAWGDKDVTVGKRYAVPEDLKMYEKEFGTALLQRPVETRVVDVRANVVGVKDRFGRTLANARDSFRDDGAATVVDGSLVVPQWKAGPLQVSKRIVREDDAEELERKKLAEEAERVIRAEKMKSAFEPEPDTDYATMQDGKFVEPVQGDVGMPEQVEPQSQWTIAGVKVNVAVPEPRQRGYVAPEIKPWLTIKKV